MASLGELLQADPLVLLRAGWRWWLTEMSAALPAWVIRLFRTADDRPIVWLDERGAIVLPEGYARPKVTALRRLGVFSTPPLVAKLLRRRRRRALTDAILRLDGRHILLATVELPAVSEQLLPLLVRNEIDRVTPFAPEQVVVGYRIVCRDRLTNRVEAELVIAKKAAVDPLVKQAERVGLRITEVTGVASDNLVVPMVAPGQEQMPAWRGWLRRPPTRRAIIVAALVLLVWIGYVFRMYRTADALEAEAAALRGQATLVSAMQSRIDTYEKQVAFLVRHRQQTAMTPVLDSLSELLPTDTYLTHLSVDSNTVMLEGMSGSSSEIPVALSKSPYLDQPRLVGPLIRERAAPGERFGVSAALRMPSKP